MVNDRSKKNRKQILSDARAARDSAHFLSESCCLASTNFMFHAFGERSLFNTAALSVMQCKNIHFHSNIHFRLFSPFFMKSVNNVQLRSVHFMPHSDIAKTGFSAKHAPILHMEPSIYINLNLF